MWPCRITVGASFLSSLAGTSMITLPTASVSTLNPFLLAKSTMYFATFCSCDDGRGILFNSEKCFQTDFGSKSVINVLTLFPQILRNQTHYNTWNGL